MAEYRRDDNYNPQGFEGKITRANPNMVCKTCKFSEKMYNGRKPSTYTAGSCEKYDIKPHDVYFEAKSCPKYKAK